MKCKNYLFLLILPVLFLFPLKTDARTLSYIYGGTNSGINDLTENNQILDLNSSWNYGNNFFANDNAVFMNTGLYFYATNLNGNILQVNADYYVGINVRRPPDSYVDYYYTDYTSGSRNIYTSSNLRCAVNSLYQSGYDTSSAPDISNFLIELEEGNYNYGGFQTHYRYHIRFNYKQLLSSNKNGNSNISCWFNIPSNQLQGQFIGTKDKLNANIGIFAKTNNLSYSVSSDPNTSILNNLVGEQKQTNQKLDELKEETKKQTEEQKKTNDLLESTDTSDAQNKGSNFFKNYSSNSHGLSGIITAPLKFLQGLTGAKCSPLKFQLPFVKEEVELRCMKSIYQEHFGVFYTLWQTITTGLIAYTVCLNFYKKIRDLQNPNNDKIEVLNL